MSIINRAFLKKLGMNVPDCTHLMAFDHNQKLYENGRFNHLEIDYESTLKDSRNKRTVMAFDAADSVRQLDPNIGVALPYLTFFNPNVITTLFTEDLSADLLANEVTGEFATQKQTFTLKEFSGSVQAYDDFSTAPTANVNYNYVTRDQYRFETSIIYGDLSVESHSLGQLNLIGDLQEAMALTMAKAHERINLYGLEDKSVHGLLNCPDFEAEIQAINVTLSPSGTKSTKWDDKAEDKQSGANHVANDVIHLFNSIVKRTRGIVGRTSDFVLVVAPEDESKLTLVNSMGVTCMNIIKGSIPNLEVKTLPQLSTDNGEGRKIMLYPKRVSGKPVGTFSHSEKLTMCKLIQQPKSVLQTCRAGTWGAIFMHPAVFGVMAIS